jgi:hypothetical protein
MPVAGFDAHRAQEERNLRTFQVDLDQHAQDELSPRPTPKMEISLPPGQPSRWLANRAQSVWTFGAKS